MNNITPEGIALAMTQAVENGVDVIEDAIGVRLNYIVVMWHPSAIEARSYSSNAVDLPAAVEAAQWAHETLAGQYLAAITEGAKATKN